VSATSIPVAHRNEPEGAGGLRRRGSQTPDRGTPLRRLLTVVVLAVCLLTVLLAVPDLRPVLHQVGAMNPALVAVAILLELASCLSFVVIFRMFFSRLPKRAARELAWSQMGSGHCCREAEWDHSRSVAGYCTS
jgi:hypothetical protein